jgi:hypothetical protein
MERCRADDEREANQQQSDTSELGVLGAYRETVECGLKKRAKLESEQQLRAENEDTRFVEALFQPGLERGSHFSLVTSGNAHATGL